jgi:hypothetical protein
MRFEYKFVPGWPWLAWLGVLSAGLFVTSKRLELLKSCDMKKIANELLQDRKEETLRALLTRRIHARLSREATVSHLQAEIEKRLRPSTPNGSYFFCNRTRGGNGLGPLGASWLATEGFLALS